MQTPQTSPRNDNNKINLSVQTANMQQVGDHPRSLQPPCRGENVAPKRNGPAERNMKKPHPLLHQWKIRWRNITTCYMTYVPVSPEFGEFTLIWVVTRHQYGISALVSHTSFGGETIGSITKCWLFSRAKLTPATFVKR